MTMRRAACGLVAALAVSVAAFACVAAPDPQPCPQIAPRDAFDVVSDAGFFFDPANDMQMPELPTGCEATALSTLLRMHGVEAAKTEVADAMPKSDSDFVRSFLGDPYSVNGGCCMSPCVADTATGFLVGRSLLAYQTEGRDLADLPTPCVVWVTIDLAEPQGPLKTQGAYEMFYPSHCVTVLGVDDDTVRTIDPLKGYAEYPRDEFERVYNVLGKQAVYIGKE